MTTRRKSANVYDYPEHLNPFHEEDNHNRLRFWTATKNKSRSNSFSFQSIKDFRGSVRLPRSRNRTDTTSSLSQLNCLGTKPKNETNDSSHTHNRFFSTLRKLSRTFSIRKKNNSNSSLDQTSQIDNDENEVQLRVSPTTRQTESYSPQKSITPLPRSRFHERVRHSEHAESKADVRELSINNNDKNPFNDESDEEAHNHSTASSHNKPITPARKKKRAPPPPPLRQSSLKEKSFTDYKASKHVIKQDTEECNTSKDEIDEINVINNVNIQIKVEEVILDSNEQNEEINNKEINNEEINTEEVEIKTSEMKNDITTNDIKSEQIKTVKITYETIQSEETKLEEEKYQKSTENEKIVLSIEDKSTIETNTEIKEDKSTIETNNEIKEDKSTIETNNEIKVTMIKEDTQIEEKEEAEILDEICPVSESNEETSSAETVPISDISPEEINYNSEINLSSSFSSISSDTKIEEKIQQAAIEDTSDLLELVNKLKMEVDKLTDDTNNNVVESEEERKVKNIQSWIKLDSPNRVKTEVNVYLDDADVICSAPLSPRLVRLKKDNEWIRHQN